jgi:hypothetical protein
MDRRKTADDGPGRRLGRLPLVALLTVGLLLSLIHCAGDGIAHAATGLPGVSMTAADHTAPSAPDHTLPCHSGHCLSHVSAQRIFDMKLPPELVPQAPSFVAERSPPALAAAAPFKPPRI